MFICTKHLKISPWELLFSKLIFTPIESLCCPFKIQFDSFPLISIIFQSFPIDSDHKRSNPIQFDRTHLEPLIPSLCHCFSGSIGSLLHSSVLRFLSCHNYHRFLLFPVILGCVVPRIFLFPHCFQCLSVIFIFSIAFKPFRGLSIVFKDFKSPSLVTLILLWWLNREFQRLNWTIQHESRSCVHSH